MGHEKLVNHYRVNFAMKQFHNWDLTYLDELSPWERYSYIDMLEAHLIEMEKERQLKEQEAKAERAAFERRLKARRI